MKTVSHYAGLALLLAPFLHLLYRAHKTGHLALVLRGALWAIALVVWSASVAYLLSN